MPAIGMGMLWGAYTLMFWGYTLVKGYAIGIGEIVIPGKYTKGWPPPLVVDPADREKAKVAPGQHPGDMPWTYPHGNGPVI